MLFGRKNKNQPRIFPNEVTRIPEGSVISHGTLYAEGDMRIDGRFFGRIVCNGKVVQGENSIIEGSLVCRNADLGGTFKGVMTICGTANILSTSHISGNLSSGHMSLDSGAEFTCECKVLSEADYETILSEARTSLLEMSASE